jgi:hypothetical protein
VTPHFVKPLDASQTAKLPDFPLTFLPAAKPAPVKPEKAEKKKADKKSKDAAEFVGPRGEQEPK